MNVTSESGTHFILMAGGHGSRWDSYSPRVQRIMGITHPYKQLLPVGPPGSVSMLQRTVDLIGEMVESDGVFGDAITIVAPVEFPAIAGAHTVSFNYPGSILQGILNTRSLWAGHQFVCYLLGDVLFSRAALVRHLRWNISRPLFLGRKNENPISGKRHPELYALNFAVDRYMGISQEMERACLKLTTPPMEREPKLWALLDYFVQKFPEKLPESAIFGEVIDYTDDIDSPEEFEAYWPRMVASALKDERKEGGMNE